MVNKKKTILHITSCHFSHDSRIVYRQCLTLANYFKVKIIIPAPDQDWINKLEMIGIPLIKSPLLRVLLIHPLILLKTIFNKADLYHFHDPELIPVGLLLHFFGKKVVFDIHENIEEHIKSMHKTGFIFKWAYKILHSLSKKYFHIILAEESYRKYYQNNGEKIHLEVVQKIKDNFFLKMRKTVKLLS